MKNNWINFIKTHAMPIFLIGGFLFDNLTLRRADLLFENLVLIAYLIVTAIGIFVINTKGEKYKFWAMAAMQFSFGNLFSAFLIFYSRSSALSASWPFLLLLVLLMIGNEVYKQRYQQLAFQVSTWFFVLFSFLIFFLPVLFKSLSAWLFAASGLVSLLLIAGLVHGLMFFIKNQVQASRRAIRIGVIGIYLAINFLYFTNLIPPIPLALKDGGVYHSIVRQGNGYKVLAEAESWFEKLWPGQTLHITSGSPLYFFSAIFSPSDLDTNIVHEWQYYDEVENDWVRAGRVVVPIVGGRESGYRLYSYQTVWPGSWRVNVETPRGQVIGRVKFEVEVVNRAPQLYPTQL